MEWRNQTRPESTTEEEERCVRPYYAVVQVGPPSRLAGHVSAYRAA